MIITKKSLSFSRNQRLITKAEFQSVFDTAQKKVLRNVVFLFKCNQQPISRLGVIVGKKTAKSAVVRNRIKRVIRESFRRNQATLNKLDIIVIARKPCETLDKQRLREGIDILWEKLLCK